MTFEDALTAATIARAPLVASPSGPAAEAEARAAADAAVSRRTGRGPREGQRLPAYNRVTKQFSNGFGLDASDLNASRADTLAQVQKMLSDALAGLGNVVTPPSGGTALFFSDVTPGLFSDGAAILFSGATPGSGVSLVFSDSSLGQFSDGSTLVFSA